MQYLLNKFSSQEAGQTISKLHGKPIAITTSYGSATLVPLYHPAVALYSATQKPTLLKDFKVIASLIN